MALPNPATGDTIQATDVSDIKNHLEGGSGKTAPYNLRQSTGNLILTTATNDGSNGIRFNDSDNSQIFYVDSNGNITIVGTMTQSGSLILPVSATPSQTTDGSIVWDSDDDTITVGDGASRKTFYYGRPAIPHFLEPVFPTTASTALTPTANTAYLMPVRTLERDVTVTKLITNSGGTANTDNVDVGIYSTTDYSTFTRVVSSGTLVAGTFQLTADIADTALTAGTIYFFAVAYDGNTIRPIVPAATTAAFVPNRTLATSFPLPSSLTGMTAVTGATGVAVYGELSGGMDISA